MKQTNRWFPLWGLFFSISLVAQAGWIVESEVVDDSADVGIYNSIAVDEAGKAHIAYYDADNQNMKSAMQDESGSWSNQVVESSGDVGSYCSVAVDSSGTSHVSYQYSYDQAIPVPPYSVTRGELKYVSGTNGTPVTVDDTQSVMGTYSSIALNDSDAPRIAYQGTTTSGTYLRYVEKNGSSWGTPQTVESGGKGASLVLDSNGYPHISHVDGTELRYVYWNGSSWVSEMVEDYQVEGERTSIALDSNGYPHIVYVNVEGLRYVYWDGSDWNDELVYSTNDGAVGVSSPSLVLNSDDEPFISFHGNLWGDLAVVVAVRNGADDWSMPAWLLEGTTPGGQTSITADTNDILHVSFHDETTGDLGYAKVMEDSDDDWLPDWWEMKYFQDLDEDGDGDPDHDGVNNADEYENGTDPTVDESGGGSWDRDGDGLSNDDEVNIYGTDPDDPDSDDDGLTDGLEVGYTFLFESFEDGFSDDWTLGGDASWGIATNTAYDEISSAQSPILSANGSAWLEFSATNVPAGELNFWYRTDSLTNHHELVFSVNGVEQSRASGIHPWSAEYTYLYAGSYTCRWEFVTDSMTIPATNSVWIDHILWEVTAIGTSPTNSDSDADGLLDGAEVNTYGTNPLDSDSDHDGLLDGEEISAGSDPYDTDSDEDGVSDGDEVHTYGTDPTLADSDSDLMPDGWELTHLLNPTNATDAATDIEPDGLTNLEEYQNNTDPRDSDTDNDGMPDGWEVDHGLAPRVYDAAIDPDSDGLNNLGEYQAGTDPQDDDSDDDGMKDGWEVSNSLNPLVNDASVDSDSDGLNNLAEYQAGTDPQDSDSENDGMPDGWEVSNSLNPLVDDASVDSDSDGLTNLAEYQAGTDPRDADSDNDSLSDGDEVNIYGTGPNDSDSDNDGLPDGWEVDNSLNPLVNDTAADPDGDGLSNLAEYQAGTDPQDTDSENDGMPDGWEADHSLSPLVDDAASDLDSDGLNNLGEYQAGTDPQDNDSENDGMPDGWEVDHSLDPLVDDTMGDPDSDGLNNLGEYQAGTDPQDNDSENDGMPDGWETDNSLNPLVDDAASDLDSDGLNNLGEYQAGTDPQDNDSENDGMPDGWEVDHSLDPLVDDTVSDPDSDGLNNLGEYQAETDPQDNDSENDGMPDGWEVDHHLDPLVDDTASDPDSDALSNLAEYQAGTDPQDNDSENDGMPDGWEVDNNLNPLLDDSTGDPDSDGLSNLAEYQAGTDPQDDDSENDGMPDGWEVDHSLNPLVDDTMGDPDSDGLNNLGEYQAGTDPQDSDSENDGMPDGWEVDHSLDPLVDDTASDPDSDGLNNLGEYQAGTDPQNADSDGDNLTDGEEVQNGSNPADPNSFDSPVWQVVLVDQFATPYNPGTPPSLAISSNGMIAMSYRTGGYQDTLDFQLIYATCSNGIWSTQTLASFSDFIGDPILKLDSNNRPHIVYKNSISGDANEGLNYRMYTGSGWVHELVEPGYKPTSYDLELGTNSEARIAFISDKNLSNHMYLASRISGTWSIEELDGGLGTSRQTDLAIDSHFATHLVYKYEGSSPAIVYWENITNAWSTPDYLSGTAQGWNPCLDVDTNQMPHMTWSHISTNILYSYWDGSSWPTETVGAGRLSSMVLDQDDHPHVLIQPDDSAEALSYATRATNGVWMVESLPSMTGWISKTSLALDAQGKPHIAWIASSGGGASNSIYYASGFEDPDGDGMPTYWEVEHGLNPGDYRDGLLDADADGLSNLAEYQRGLNPENPDMDSDGLTDGSEVNTFYTNPTNSDSDSDTMPDGWEVSYGLNPLLDDRMGDPDSDSLRNELEYQYGSSPILADTDSDGLNDAAEALTFGTNPSLYDTDGDGLSDGQEALAEQRVSSESFEPEPVAAPLAMRAMADAPAEGVGGLPSGWSTSGDAPWSLVSDEAYDGSGSIRSGIIADSQVSTLEFTTNLNAGRISFWAKCSSENESDTLEFLVDGATSNIWSGEVAWTNVSASFTAGLHTFRWVYAKDGSGSDGSDAAWLDLVEFFENGIGTDPLDSDTDGDAMGDGWEVAYGFDPLASADGTADADGDGSLNKNEYIADTDPNDSNDWFRITAIDAATSQVLHFDSSADRVYSLLSCSNLISGSWTTNVGVSSRAGVGGPDSIEVTNSFSKGFYKLTVELP